MAFEPIDTTTHSRAIDEQYLKVVNGDPDTTWLIISPNSKKQYEPELVGTSFSEFLQSFDETKVQYGLARVSPPGSDVQKLILIGWCPDSAPLKTRSSFAQNFAAVSNQVFKTYHVQVTARDEDDLDEKELLMKISNSAGARYSIQQTSSKKTSSTSGTRTATKPVSTSAHKPVFDEKQRTSVSPPRRSFSPKPTESANKKDDEWGEPELEERDFKQKPLKPSSSSWKPIGKVDLQKVIAEENQKEDPRLVVTGSTYNKKIDPQSEIAKLKQESKLKRDAEYSQVLGTKGPSPVSKNANDNDDKVIRGYVNEKSPAQLWAEKKRGSSSPVQAKKVEKESEGFSDSDKEEEPKVEDVRSKFESMNTDEVPIIKPKEQSKFTQSAHSSGPNESVSNSSKKFGQPLPGLHDQKKPESDGWSDDDEQTEEELDTSAPSLPRKEQLSSDSEQDEEKQEPVPSLPTRRNIPPAMHQEAESEADDDDNDSFDEPEPEPEPAKTRSPVPPPAPRRSQAPKEPQAPSAVAEYDYEAGEDNELTFQENDIIINIQFVDDDWWLGELESSGEKGLFPSNYVNLQA